MLRSVVAPLTRGTPDRFPNAAAANARPPFDRPIHRTSATGFAPFLIAVSVAPRRRALVCRRR
ncbi:MAG TPA: hypothetical protein VIH24_07820, partial [Candidatus Limnocylindria bacterium]